MSISNCFSKRIQKHLLAILSLLLVSNTSFANSIDKPLKAEEESETEVLQLARIVDAKQYSPFDPMQRVLNHLYAEVSELDYKMVYLPSQRAQVLVSQGQLDGEAGRINGEVNYRNLIPIAEPILTLDLVSYCLKKHKCIGQGNNNDLIIGFPRGFRAIKHWCEAQGYNCNEFHHHQGAYQALHLGRVDTVIATNFYPLNQPWVDKNLPIYTKVIKTAKPLEFNHFLHAKHKHHIEALNLAMIKIKKEGVIDTIAKEYFEAQKAKNTVKVISLD